MGRGQNPQPGQKNLLYGPATKLKKPTPLHLINTERFSIEWLPLKGKIPSRLSLSEFSFEFGLDVGSRRRGLEVAERMLANKESHRVLDKDGNAKDIYTVYNRNVLREQLRALRAELENA